MTDAKTPTMPAEVSAIMACGHAIWKDPEPSDFKRRFDDRQIPVAGVRHVRVWGLQVDDERELPGKERTLIPDEDIWEVNLTASDGSHYEVDSRLLRPAEEA